MEFQTIKVAVQRQLDKMAEHELYIADVNGYKLAEDYLTAFPEGTNPMFRERTEHDCTCCRQFIRDIGNVVAFIDGEIVSVWDITVDNDYQVVADKLSAIVKAATIQNVFRHECKNVGTTRNKEGGITAPADAKVWEHFHYALPQKFIMKDSIPTYWSETRSNKEVLERSLTEISSSAIDTVIDLIGEDLYRGEEHLFTVKAIQKAKGEYDASENKELFLWEKSLKLGHASKFRNTVIGTLLSDISEGVELDRAVKSFETKVAPQNYKRTSSVVTEGMKKKAVEQITELGLIGSLPRRGAVMEDLTINNVIFADRDAKTAMGAPSILDIMESVGEATKPNVKGAKEVGVQDFMDNILPKATSLDVMMENKHSPNLVSLIAPVDPDAKLLFKWQNGFSWSYNGEVADSLLRQQVRGLGGNVDAVMRFSHTWNYDGKNQSLMDLHVFWNKTGYHSSNYEKVKKETHDNYGGKATRVGWNNRKNQTTGAVQDVDFVNPPGKAVPVENIAFPNKGKMPDGVYSFKVHNWQLRQPTSSGFKAEIELDGTIYSYEYPKALGNKQWITLAEVTLKDGVFSIEHFLDSSETSKEVWGVNSNTWTKVSTILNSPNHWDGEETGNKHLFFMLERCYNPDPSRGFYNEFLRGDLSPHRKFFEVLSSKMKTEVTEDQLSGLGFSSTVRNSLVCRVDNKQTFKINF